MTKTLNIEYSSQDIKIFHKIINDAVEGDQKLFCMLLERLQPLKTSGHKYNPTRIQRILDLNLELEFFMELIKCTTNLLDLTDKQLRYLDLLELLYGVNLPKQGYF